MLQVLIWGEPTELKSNPDHQNWQCKMEGEDLDGEPLTIVVAILEKEFALLCITAHG
jgi:hypothetical protein